MALQYNKAQKEAIHITTGNVAVNATAGSGKTTMLIGRICNLIENHNVSPSEILAITFSRKARKTLQEKADNNGLNSNLLNIETFHSLAFKIMLRAGNPNKEIIKSWEQDKIISECLQMYRLDIDKAEILDFISKSKTLMLLPENSLRDFKILSENYENLHKIYAYYEKRKTDDFKTEYDDFVNNAIMVLESNESLLMEMRMRFRYIMVDEYQDTNYNQNYFINLLSSGDNLMVVGDVFQAIYGFRGGESQYLLDFEKTHSDTHIIAMNTNYRCTDKIVKLANAIESSLPESLSEHYVPSEAIKTSNDIPTFTEFNSDMDEAAYLAETIKDSGLKYGDICVLARTNAQLQVIQSEFARHNLPFNMKDGQSVVDIPEVKLIISYILLAHNTSDDEAFRYIYNKPNRWLGAAFLSEVVDTAQRMRSSLYEAMENINRRHWRYSRGIEQIQKFVKRTQKKNPRNFGTLVAAIRRELNIDAYLLKTKGTDSNKSDSALDNLDSFQNLCKSIKTYDEFICMINDIRNGETDDEKKAIKLMTIHKSKGLEFPIVFLIGCSDGLLPHSRNSDLDEEKKIFYVGVTRAASKLYLTAPKKYNGNSLARSEFIDIAGETIKIIKKKKGKNK